MNITVYLGALQGNDPVLKDAVKEMTRDPLIYQMLGDHTYNKYLEAKRLKLKPLLQY